MKHISLPFQTVHIAHGGVFCFQRKSKAKEIFEKYVSVRGSNSVNIDSNARKQAEVQLENPTPQTFEVAQAQVGFVLISQGG